MKPTLHPSENRLSHWLKSRHVLISFLLLLAGLLGPVQESTAQVLYGADAYTFSRYDIATKTWTPLASRFVRALTTLNGEVQPPTLRPKTLPNMTPLPIPGSNWLNFPA